MKWKPVDVLVILLAGSMTIAMIITTVVPIILGEPISDARTKSIAAVAEKMLLIIAGYVGLILGRNGND